VSCRALWFALAVALLTACSRQPDQPAVERVAILRFENVGQDASVDWMGRAFPEIIAGELAGTADLYAIPSARLHSMDGAFGVHPVSAPGVSSERALAVAQGANRIGYGEYRVHNGKLEARLTIEDPASHKVLSSVSVDGPAGDVVAVASSLAQHISGRISHYATRSSQSVKTYVTVLEGATSGSADALQESITTDPDFAPAYRQLAQIKLTQQDRAGALSILNRLLGRGGSVSPLERARTELQAAALSDDVAAREHALTALSHADPADPIVWRDLGVTYMARHQYAQAAAALRAALRIEPDDVESLNQFGYAAVYAGNLDESLRALHHYLELQPDSPNALDSLGDINLVVGRFTDAESYYLSAAKKNPEFFAGMDFLRAAMSRLMRGDLAAADDAAHQYISSRAAVHDPLVDYRQAQWQWISGRRKAAFEMMAKLAAGPEREVAAHANGELALWSLMLGKREAAAALAAKGLSMATPSSAGTGALAQFLSQPPASPAEWTARADRLAPNPAQATVRATALAYALLLGKEYQAAGTILANLYNQDRTAAEGLPILLGWTELEAGRNAEAAALLHFNPIPPTAGLEPLTSFYFPRLFYLRGLAAERQGKTAEARENYAIFQKLSGPDAFQWGEEQKAR
jgi:Flp pilus assembly protein TadD